MSKKPALNTTFAVAIVVISILLPTIIPSQYWISVLVTAAINILLVASLRSIGIVGHLSLGHIGFALLGAYCSALLVMKYGISFWVAIVFAGLFSALIAFAIGYPFLKVKGIYFAVLTLLTAETLRLTLYYLKSISGGSMGLVGIPRPKHIAVPLIGIIKFNSPANYYYLVLIILILSLLVLYLLEKSSLGFKWKAISDSSELAQSIGINVLWLKVLNFAIASFFAGIAGALFAHFQQALIAIPSSKFGPMMSIYLVLYMIVGGTSNFTGPILGVLALTIISEFCRPFKLYQPMIIGGIALFIVLFIPQGLVGLPNRLLFWFKRLPLRKI